jgi:UDP:flavonoid glycosyltransferase YjiC (YdhE family)
MTTRHESDSPPRRIAFFISPHGFGHAARAAGVMEAMAEIQSSILFDIFTTVPGWFFSYSDTFAYRYHSLLTDIGLVQKSPFQEDLPATVEHLKNFLPFDQRQIASLAEKIRHIKCELVICDIAPMGILIAGEAGVPSVLIENFTWDWIYQGYAEAGMKAFNQYLQSIFAEATCHIQTQPICNPAPVDFTAAPTSRKIKTPSGRIRQRLGLTQSDKIIMITAGGVPKIYGFIEKLKSQTAAHFIIAGSGDSVNIQDNLILLPENSEFFHPDLINASDAVIGKVGYSTIAEVYHAGIPFGYSARAHYRESAPLVNFIENKMHGFVIGQSEFNNGDWIDRIEELLALPRVQRNTSNGADQIAGFISGLLKQ